MLRAGWVLCEGWGVVVPGAVDAAGGGEGYVRSRGWMFRKE